jgi:hypothetical protein
MPKFQPVAVPVQMIRNPGDFASPPVFGTQTGRAATESAHSDAAEEAEARPQRQPLPGTARRALIPNPPEG